MESGTTVYRAYVSQISDTFRTWIDEAVVTEIVLNGKPLVKIAESLLPLTDDWRLTRREAKQDQHRALLRHIGTLQARADAMADELLHEDLAAELVS